MNKRRRTLHGPDGFTLIELLVVIAIIGILASIMFAALNLSRSKARDARRIADFNNIKLALNLYFDEHNSYPNPQDIASCGASATDTWSDFNAPTHDCWESLIPTRYMAMVPLDPINDAYGKSCNVQEGCHVYHYCYLNKGQNFDLGVDLENPPLRQYGNAPAYGNPPVDCPTAGPNQYWVTN